MKNTLNPIGQSARVRDRGREAFKAGKSFDDNPYVHLSKVSLSSWWQAGYLNAKRNEETEGTDN